MKTTQPVTFDTANFEFWDIESLPELFTVSVYNVKRNLLKVFYSVEPGTKTEQDIARYGYKLPPNMADIIKKANPVIQKKDGIKFQFFDLFYDESNNELARTLGLSDAYQINNPSHRSTYPDEFRLVCDTDHTYDPFFEHPYICGYNSINYDTTLISIYLALTFANYAKPLNQRTRDEANRLLTPPTPSEMREYNDDLFTAEYINNMPTYLTRGAIAEGKGYKSLVYRIRKNMLMSGRHLDIARLNELQIKTALKRLLGMMGHQILEMHNDDDITQTLAYNVSDIVYLYELAKDPVYSQAFNLKKALLDQYPETIYAQKSDSYAPNISPHSVRNDRLNIDSTSSQFAQKTLCPYGHLNDIPTVSFQYPHPDVAKELGVESFDVLDEARNFFYSKISDPEARAEFDRVYQYYSSIRGKNFNTSEAYLHEYKIPGTMALPTELLPYNLKDINNPGCTLSYYNADGTRNSCWITFSTGGLHGAEANLALYNKDYAVYQSVMETIEYAKSIYPEAHDMRLAKKLTLPDGREISYKDVLTSKGTIKHRNSEYKSADKLKPNLFGTAKNGARKDINARYVLTSVENCIHEDFKSYYPLLLTRMKAFFNPHLGTDRYLTFYHQKEEFGKKSKAADISVQEKLLYLIAREGVKLIINAASGAADASFDNPIRMNNTIISMRLIGQLLTWWVAQATTFAGGKVPSTNTDGIYSVCDLETSEKILHDLTQRIHIDIEPEEMIIITKDSNNRVEIMYDRDDKTKTFIVNGSGSSAGCFKGPTPRKALNHPAIIDYITAEYLHLIGSKTIIPGRTEPLSINDRFDREVGKYIIESALKKMPLTQKAMMFQNVIAANRSSITYPFALWEETTTLPDGQQQTTTKFKALQMYNRVFFVQPTVPDTVRLQAAGAWSVSESSYKKRLREGLPHRVDNNVIANSVLREHGWVVDTISAQKPGYKQLPTDQDITVRKINSIDPDWPVIILNEDLHNMDEKRLQAVLDNLDLDIYITMAQKTFNSSWYNELGDNSMSTEDILRREEEIKKRKIIEAATTAAEE